MALCKIYLMLSALITCHVSADYEYERMKNWNPRSIWHPWYKQYEVYEGASSEIMPHYSYHGLSKHRPTVHYSGSPTEPFPITIKKEPIEEKLHLKKIPFYAFAGSKDSTRYKELTPDMGVAHCQEIKVKSIGKRGEPKKGITTCYNCKDPKTKSRYERCLYSSSHPEESASSTTKVERYISAPTGFRYRRSNFERNKSDYERRRNPYRFTEEYFTDSTRDVPAAYKNKGEKCDKIVKDSMVCMVCKDAKTNGKYEQCSYVRQPHEKAYSYVKSSSFGKPRGSDSDKDAESTSHSEVSDDEDESHRQKDDSPSTESHEYSYPSDYPEKSASTVDKRDEVQDDAPSAADCKEVQKDSKTCMVCKDPKVGGTYEKCTYNYQPSDKLYKYSKSKSFEYPTKSSDSNKTSEKSTSYDYPQSSESTHDYEKPSYSGRSDRVAEVGQASNDSDGPSHEYSSDYSSPEESREYQFPSHSNDHESYESQETSSTKPASEDHAESAVNADNCKTVQKDSMQCTICKDPKTGNDFEQCSYSYQPSDKSYAYSKSTSFNNPSSDKSEPTSREDEHSSESSEATHKYVESPGTGQTYEATTTDEAKAKGSRNEAKASGKKVDAGYADTVNKKAEIEEFMQSFRKKDRSKCKRIMRDKMTCYQCVDDNGFQKEECAFVTGRDEPDRDQLVFRETKEFQVDAAQPAQPAQPRSARNNKPSSTRKTKAVESLEPHASASKSSYVRLEKPDSDYPDEASASTAAEETKEAEPYDYTSETRLKYDKVLGLTLPAYMFATSEHEAAFDEIVASSHN